MPDWSYRTVLRSTLFCLPAEAARRVAVGALAALARAPGGLGVIDFLGHMQPDRNLARDMGRTLAIGPVGLGAFVDPKGDACAALSRFGAGFVEIGPVVSSHRQEVAPRWDRAAVTRTLSLRGGHLDTTLQDLSVALTSSPRPTVPLWIRIGTEHDDLDVIAEVIGPWASSFVLDVADDASPTSVASDVAQLVTRARADGKPRSVFVSVRTDQEGKVELARHAWEAGARGIWIRAERVSDNGARMFQPLTAELLSAVSALRETLPADFVIVAGGVYEPEDVRLLLQAGAQLTAVEAGLVFSGPGLIKRCNDALTLDRRADVEQTAEVVSLAAARHAWFWALLLGVSMLFGGALALVIASTRVVLPYDEALCGMTRAQLMQVNPRLLPFMAHDRVTLAGSMLSIGFLYQALAWNGVRRGQHWAQVAVVASALIGFASMFLFLGFGYFDPFHAFVTTILFQFLLLCVFAPLGDAKHSGAPEWIETAAWRRAQWGQLIFVVIGAGFILSGAVIAYIGITSVFVAEDLAFMRTTAAQLAVAHERLIALVAHDRASLGGMLMANGLTILLSALWGFRGGAGWLWRAFAVAGNVGFAAAIGVHYVVGYHSLFHLAPAFAGWALWLLGLALTREWMHGWPRLPSP